MPIGPADRRAKADETTRAAKEFLYGEADERRTKTAKLKKARLAKEDRDATAAQATSATKTPARRARRPKV